MSPKQTRLAAIALALLFLIVDGAAVVVLRTRPWTLVIPGVVLAFSLARPRQSDVSWRDAVAVMFLLTVPFVARMPADWPLRARVSLNSFGSAGLVLFVIAAIHGDGIGAGLRERTWSALRGGLRDAGHRIVAVLNLLVTIFALSYIERAFGTPPILRAVAFIAAIAGLLPERWSASVFSSGATVVLGFLVLGGAAAGSWPWAAVPFSLLCAVLGSAVRKLTVPVPLARTFVTPSTNVNDETSIRSADRGLEAGPEPGLSP